MSSKPSVLRYLNSDVFKINFVIFNHGFELCSIKAISKSGTIGAMGTPHTASKTSQIKFDLRFEMDNLNYPLIYVHISSNSHFGGL